MNPFTLWILRLIAQWILSNTLLTPTNWKRLQMFLVILYLDWILHKNKLPR